jgi:ribosomal protein S6--L-glutamate ligase
MKIAILSRGPKLYSTRRLKEACEKRGHEAWVMSPLAFDIDTEQGSPDLYFKGKRVVPFDAVIPRIGASITLFGTAVVRQFEQMGVFSANSAQAISVSRDKLRSIQILCRHRIGIPHTALVHNLDHVVPTIERMGGPPIVIKLLEGTQGIGVILADTANVAKSIIEVLHSAANQNVLIQAFVKESKGRDIRALVVGNKVVAAMRRVAQGDEFRSNVHRGGRTELVELEPEYERTAIHAAQILGLHVAGVDMLEGNDGPMIMEVNSSPGLEGIEEATGIDVADGIVEHIEEQVLFPEIDLRQRLTLQSGYAVMEVPVAEGSELAQKTLSESGLRNRDIVVLTIQRGSVSIPNPKGSREILPGDRLLCFGKMIALRALSPDTAVREAEESSVPTALAGDEPAEPEAPQPSE